MWCLESEIWIEWSLYSQDWRTWCCQVLDIFHDVCNHYNCDVIILNKSCEHNYFYCLCVIVENYHCNYIWNHCHHLMKKNYHCLLTDQSDYAAVLTKIVCHFVKKMKKMMMKCWNECLHHNSIKKISHLNHWIHWNMNSYMWVSLTNSEQNNLHKLKADISMITYVKNSDMLTVRAECVWSHTKTSLNSNTEIWRWTDCISHWEISYSLRIANTDA